MAKILFDIEDPRLWASVDENDVFLLSDSESKDFMVRKGIPGPGLRYRVERVDEIRAERGGRTAAVFRFIRMVPDIQDAEEAGNLTICAMIVNNKVELYLLYSPLPEGEVQGTRQDIVNNTPFGDILFVPGAPSLQQAEYVNNFAHEKEGRPDIEFVSTFGGLLAGPWTLIPPEEGNRGGVGCVMWYNTKATDVDETQFVVVETSKQLGRRERDTSSWLEVLHGRVFNFWDIKVFDA